MQLQIMTVQEICGENTGGGLRIERGQARIETKAHAHRQIQPVHAVQAGVSQIQPQVSEVPGGRGRARGWVARGDREVQFRCIHGRWEGLVQDAGRAEHLVVEIVDERQTLPAALGVRTQQRGARGALQEVLQTPTSCQGHRTSCAAVSGVLGERERGAVGQGGGQGQGRVWTGGQWGGVGTQSGQGGRRGVCVSFEVGRYFSILNENIKEVVHLLTAGGALSVGILFQGFLVLWRFFAPPPRRGGGGAKEGMLIRDWTHLGGGLRLGRSLVIGRCGGRPWSLIGRGAGGGSLVAEEEGLQAGGSREREDCPGRDTSHEVKPRLLALSDWLVDEVRLLLLF